MFSILYLMKSFIIIRNIKLYTFCLYLIKFKIIGVPMMHYSPQSYQALDAKKKQLKQLNAKTNGSYISAPLIQKALSTKPLAWRHVFRSFVQGYPTSNQSEESYLDFTEQQPLTMKLINLGKISDQKTPKDDVIKQFRRHYRIDIKQYLKRKYQKQTYQIPIEAFELLRYVDTKQSPWKTTFLQVYKPYYFHDNLKRRIQHCNMNYAGKDPEDTSVLKRTKLPKLFRQLLKCSVQFGGLDNFIMTTSNVYMEEDLETLQINYTSFAGLTLYKGKCKIGAHQYFEIAPYLTQNMLESSNIGLQQRIRFFLINCLCIIIKKNFTLESPQVEAQKTYEYSQVLQKLKKQSAEIKNQFAEEKKRMSCKQVVRLGMAQLIRDGLVQNKPLSWQRILKSICIGEQINETKQGKKVEEKKQPQSNQQFAKQLAEVFSQLHETLLMEDEQKQFYKQRGLDSKYLYIPVKYRGELGLMFEKKAWWDIFNYKLEENDKNSKFENREKRVYNFLHEPFCFRLLNAILKRYINATKTIELANKFKSDKSISIIFNYLDLAQMSPLMGQKHENQIPQFKTLYTEYQYLKENYF